MVGIQEMGNQERKPVTSSTETILRRSYVLRGKSIVKSAMAEIISPWFAKKETLMAWHEIERICQLLGKVPAQSSGPHGTDTSTDTTRH